MRRSSRHNARTRDVGFRPRIEVAEPRILLAITSRAAASIVNTSTTGNQNSPAVAMDVNGDSIVVWKDASKENSAGGYISDIRAQRYTPSGVKAAGEFRVESESNANFIERLNPAVAMDPAGDFVVAWVRNDTTVTGNYLYEIQARVYNASGTALTNDINITGNLHSSRNSPAVAMDGSGNWLVTWTDQGNGTDVFARKFNLNGTPQVLAGSTNALLVNVGSVTGNQFDSSVGMDSAGDFVVTWTSLANVNGGDTEVFARQFSPTASVIGAPIHVNTTTAQGQSQAEVAVASAGDFIVAWANDPNDGTSGRGDILARRFNADGSARTGEVQVNASSVGFQLAPDVDLDANGNATIVWGNIPNSNGTNPGVFARRLNALGVPIEAADIRVATQAGSDQDSPSVAVDNQGDAVFGYRQINGSGPSTDTDIYAHFYQYVNDAPTLNIFTNLTIPQGAGAQTVNLAGITAGGGESQTLTVTATSNNPNLIPNPTLTYTSPDATGSLAFTPQANAFGSAVISVTVTDNGGTANGGVNRVVRIFAVNVVGAPTANGQSVSVAHNAAKAITLTGSDPNSPPKSLTYLVATNPSHGTLSGTAPNLTYTPTAGYQGSDSFTFKVNNGTSDSNTATVSLTVAAATPTATAQAVNVAHNTARAITLTGTDGDDRPALPLTFAVATNPTHGTLSGFNATTGAVTYTPSAGYRGTDSFTFTTSNGQTTSSSATVTLNVAAGAPTANPQSVTTTANTAKAITLTGSDPNVPALPLTFSIATNPAHGTLSGFNPATGAVTYTPTAGYSGPDSFQFQDNNGSIDSNVATVSITVIGKPTANNQSVTTNEETAVGVTLTGSDPNSPPRSLTYTVTAAPAHGTLSGTAPNLTYTPNSNYSGPDSFQFQDNNGALDSNIATVSITVTPINDAPTLNPIADLTIAQGAGEQTVNLSGISAGGGESQNLTVTATSNNLTLITNLTVTYTSPNATGVLKFTPQPNGFGTATITVEVKDGGGTANGGSDTVTRQFTVTVIGKPSANDQSVATNQNTAVAVTLSGSDPNSPARALTYAVTTSPAHGTLSGTAPNLTYTPNAGYDGPDSFQFKDNNGVLDSNIATVSITVSSTNHAPTANSQTVTVAQDTAKGVTLTGSDVDGGDTLTYSVTTSPAHGTLGGSAPNLTYTPNAGYFGADSFQFKVTDNHGAGSNVATVTLNVVGKPTANAQDVTTNQGTPVGITLTGSDPNSPPRALTYTVTTPPAHGTLSGTAPNLTYTPNAGYSGPDSFQFKDSNGVLDSSIATVSITVVDVTAPQVTDVLVRFGGRSVSVFDLSRTFPWSTINKIEAVFSEDVVISQGDLSLTGVNVPSYMIDSFSYDAATHTATWGLPTPIGVDRVLMDIDGHSASGVKDLGGNLLGGGMDYLKELDVLPGDINGDGAVNASDLALVRNMQLGISAATAYGDINGDGVVDLADYNLVRSFVGKKLPPKS